MPSIGCPNNFAFPGVQLNLAPSVAFEECKGVKYYILYDIGINPESRFQSKA